MREHHIARKRFGQNFLRDISIIKKIIQVINPEENQVIIEIGPGLGAITELLINNCQKLIAIEIDRDLIEKLQIKFKNYNNFTLINQDVLQVDFEDLIKNLDINLENISLVGNLPYNISTPLLFKLFQNAPIVDEYIFMLQKEVADRLVANSNCKQYGRLSIMAQYHCKIYKLFDVPSFAFEPQPKVTSSIVKFIPYKELPVKAENYTTFNKIVTQAFCHRRKTIANSIKALCNIEVLNQLNIDSKLRPEQLRINDFVEISNQIAKN